MKKRWQWMLPVCCLVLVFSQGCVLQQKFPFAASTPPTPTPFQAQSPTARPSPTPTSLPSPTLLPSATPTALACRTSPGRVEVFEETFATSSRPFHFRVYTPPCYGQEQARYPVLVMIHGQSFSDDQWERLGIAAAADALIHAGQAAPFLIVMPREANTYQDIFESTFASDITAGLLPWLDARYTTCAERACRAIGGLSRGGAWALRIGFTRWDIFGAIGLHSTPPFIGDPNRLPGWLAEIPAGSMPRIWMDTGRADWYLRPTTQFEQILTSNGVPHEWYLFNGTHEEDYWSAHVSDYLRWYTQNW